MFPTLLQIGPISITSLGVSLVIGFFLGSFLIWKKEKEENFDEEKIMDAILLVTLVSLIASRTWYVIFYWVKVGGPLAWFDFSNKAGFSWVGALIGGVLTLKFICKKNRWDFFKVADFSTFGLVLGSIFVHLGTFLDGSSYGTPTNLPWGIKFPGLETHRHPTQLYELVLMLLLLRLLYYFDRHYRTYNWYKNKRGEAVPGFLFLSFLGFLSLSKLIVVFFKEHDLYWRWLQAINFIVLLISLGIIYFRSGERLNLGFPLMSAASKKRKLIKKRSRVKTGMEAK